MSTNNNNNSNNNKKKNNNNNNRRKQQQRQQKQQQHDDVDRVAPTAEDKESLQQQASKDLGLIHSGLASPSPRTTCAGGDCDEKKEDHERDIAEAEEGDGDEVAIQQKEEEKREDEEEREEEEEEKKGRSELNEKEAEKAEIPDSNASSQDEVQTGRKKKRLIEPEEKPPSEFYLWIRSFCGCTHY